MQRRDFLTLAGGAVALPFAARAQQAMPVIGFLHSGSPRPNANRLAGFRKGLHEAGFVEGQNVTIEFRWAEDRSDRLRDLAADLVRRKVNVITTLSATQAALAAKAATTTIPHVFQVGSDPVAIGLVASLNKPGGNATGISSLAAEIMPKRIGLLRELIPSIANVFVLTNPTNPNTKIMAAELQEISRSQNVQGQILHARNDEEIQAAFKQMAQKPSRALVIGNDPAFFIRRTQLAMLAVSHRVPMIGYEREFVIDGGLMSYGPNSGKSWEMAGGYVARTVAGIREAGGVVEQDPESDLLTINREFSASVVVVRCLTTPTGSRRWRIRFDVGLWPDITVAVRMDEPNQNPLDYYLLPRIDMTETNVRLAEDNGVSFDSYRFESLEAFFALAARATLQEVA